ncbi:MAG: hypothetical protein WD512_02945 [Candidatus Paceibacterota bacterium]
MISHDQIRKVFALKDKFSQLIDINPSIKREFFDKNEFFEIIVNELKELLEYIIVLISLKKYIEDEYISTEIDNIIEILNELYDNYQENKDSDSFDIKIFTSDNVIKIIHLTDNTAIIYKDVLGRAEANLINELE